MEFEPFEDFEDAVFEEDGRDELVLLGEAV